MPGRGQGRGRGGRGGRGGNRGGRAGRGFRRGRGGANIPRGNANEWDVDGQVEQAETLNIDSNLKDYFISTASFEQHFDAQETNKTRYVAGMAVLESTGVEISQNAKIRALAAAWARRDSNLASSFLSNRNLFGLVEVLKALTLLDSSRRIRVEEKKLKRLQMCGNVKPRLLGKFKSSIDNLTAIKPKHGSASGAVCKHIRKWVRNFTKEELEFYALHYPTEPWKKLADICHFNPKNDFKNLPWFLPYCFGGPAPEETMVHRCKGLTADNVNDLIKEFPIPYSHIKDLKDKLTEESKGRIASYDKLDTLLWYYEDLQCKEVDEIIEQRLTAGEKITLATGKFLERLLTIKMIREEIPVRSYGWYGRQAKKCENPTKACFFHKLLPLAQKMMEEISLPLEPPIVVIGDRSGSMEVAIRTSTIIASLLTAIASAKLVFFNNENMDAEFIPKNIEDVLEMAITITANGGTAPAASLWPFYERKEVVNTFIVVTDEEENQKNHNFDFAELYKKYHDEVHPAKLVFVSFLRNQHSTGMMVSKLNNMGFNPSQFKFDSSRPDLTKIDKMFGLLSSDSSNFEDMVKTMETEITNQRMQKTFQNLNIEKDVQKA